MKVIHSVTIEQIKAMAQHFNRLVYGFQTCWWKIGDPVYRLQNGSGLPCGPRGEMLLETDKPMDFIEMAIKNPEHYGKHGIDAFVAAYHGNVITDHGRPTSFDDWDKYNELIDQSRSLGA